MPSIKENIQDITNGVKKLGNEAKTAAAKTKRIGNELKFDDTNIDLIQQRYKSLSEELSKTTAYINEMKKAQADLTAQKADAELLKDAKEREKTLKDINKLIADYEVKIASATEKQIALKYATDETKYNQSLVAAATQQVNEKFAKSEELAEKVSTVVKKSYAQVKKLALEAIDSGTELYSLSKRFNTSVEDIQLWNRTMQVATGQSDVFTNSLKKIVQGMSQVASGRGVAYQNALKAIGVSYKDIAELDTAAQFEAIAQGLAGIENQSLRTAYAEQLLGDSGQYLSEVLDGGLESLEAFQSTAERFGYLSTEDAEKLNKLNIAIEQFKSNLQVVGAELVESLEPTIEMVGNFITKVLVPGIKAVAGWFQKLGGFGSTLLIIGTASLILLPKIIGFIKMMTTASLQLAQANTQVGATAAVAGAKMQIAFGWIGVIIGVLSVLSILIGSLNAAEEASDGLNDSLDETLTKSQGIVSGSASDYTTTTEQLSTKTTQYETTIDVTIRGEGDTKLSDEQMMTTAQLTAAEVNKSLGELVK